MHAGLPISPQRGSGIEDDEYQHEKHRRTFYAFHDLVSDHVGGRFIHQIHETNHQDHEAHAEQTHDDEKYARHHLA